MELRGDRRDCVKLKTKQMELRGDRRDCVKLKTKQMELRGRQMRWCQAEDTADIVKGVTEEIVLS